MKCHLDFSLFGKNSLRFNYRVFGYIELDRKPEVNDFLCFAFDTGVVRVVKNAGIKSLPEENAEYLKIEGVRFTGDIKGEISITAADWNEEKLFRIPELVKQFAKKFGLFVDDHLEFTD